MPKYAGTITFDGSKTLEQKELLLKQIPDRISQQLSYHLSNKYVLTYSIEYHKVGGEDDPEAPHVHFILHSDKYITSNSFKRVAELFKYTYGRSQFYIPTNMKYLQYKTYIKKDVEKNEKLYNKKHYFVIPLKTKKKEELPEIIDDYSYDFDSVDDID